MLFAVNSSFAGTPVAGCDNGAMLRNAVSSDIPQIRALMQSVPGFWQPSVVRANKGTTRYRRWFCIDQHRCPLP